MPEGSKDTAVLIAVSYQALIRALRKNPETLPADCTVLILFAGFYIEATLNHIFESTDKNIKTFPISEQKPQGKSYPGLNDKLAWFYNEFIEEPKAVYWNEIEKKGIYDKLEWSFPGYSELLKFRNDISHGIVNESAFSLQTAINLRQKAKDIVEKLYSIVNNCGKNVPRLITYKEAINYSPMIPKFTASSSSDVMY